MEAQSDHRYSLLHINELPKNIGVVLVWGVKMFLRVFSREEVAV
jgi:hypothetical protein